MGAGMESNESRVTGGEVEVTRRASVEADRAVPRRVYREEARPMMRATGGRGHSLATFLGWFSIGLGLVQFLGPRRMARLVGANDDESTASLMRLLGMREIASGVGILTTPRPDRWLQARLGGDLMDLALLAPLLSNDNPHRDRSVMAAAAVMGAGTLDAVCAMQLSRDDGERGLRAEVGAADGNAVEHRNSVTISRPPEEVYAFWRDFGNLPRFMRHLESVEVLDDGVSLWKAKAPAGRTVEWKAEMTEDVPNRRIAWRSLPGSDVHNEGVVTFAPAPGGRGTEVRVHFAYDAPGGAVGSALAKLFREEPGQQVAHDLRHLKQVLETGDVVVSDATLLRGPHPAQPEEVPQLH